MTLYAAQPFIFDEQVTLLRELAESLSFGIITLRARQDRDEALKCLEQKTCQLRALAAELARVEDKERRRLAQILHDDFQQGLVAARFQIGNLRRFSSVAPFQAEIGNVDKTLQECLETSRSLTSELCPRVLCEPSLGAALQWLGRRFQEKHGLTVKVVADKGIGVNQEELRVALFHAVRELLFNTVKHAQVKQAHVRLSRAKDGRVRVVVSDKGVGFDPAQIRAKEGLSGGFGLFRLRERIAHFGELDVKSAPGKGSRFTLSARDNGGGHGEKLANLQNPSSAHGGQ